MIYVLTYQTMHRKTVDTLMRLKMCGYDDVTVYAKPLHYKKTFQPIYEHRPKNYNFGEEITYEKVISNLGYILMKIDEFEEIQAPDNSIVLICGAGIIPEDMIKRYRIINAHPGYIPNTRGLDAFKWAIEKKEPIGVSVHLLGDYIDAGDVIERQIVTVKDNDTFHAVAQRVYETEIAALVDAIEKVDKILFFTDGEEYPVHKRMPEEIEKNLLTKFEEYKRQKILRGV